MGSDGEARPNPVADWIQGHLIASALIAIGLLVAVGLLLASLGGDDPSEEATETSSTFASGPTTTSQAAATEDPNRPEVPQVDCRALLTDDEVDEALFGDEVSGPRGFFTFAQGETCLHEPDDDSGHYIQIEPGDPSDFEDGAQLSGVFGESVDGVADGARWFDDGSDLGILSVGANIEDASIIYRIHIGRSDLDRTRRLEQATELALAALPRFPGTDPGDPAPLVDLCALVGDEQADEILAEYRDAHPATRDEIMVTDNFSDLVDLREEGDATCRKLILAEIYIEAQQGSISDFEPGASMDGVAAETVAGLGDDAVWFADVPYQGSFTAPHERGVLAMRVGEAMFRIVVAFPATASEEQLEIASSLAATAALEIPGAPAPESVLVEPDPVDLPPSDYAANLLTREESGDWTRGEGLVATLRLLAGEGGESEVLAGPAPSDRSAWEVMALAREYVEAEPGTELAAEIARLIGVLAPPRAQLEEASSGDDVSAGTGSLLVSLVPLAQEQEEDELQDGPPNFCSTEFGITPPCLITHLNAELEATWPDKYILMRPEPAMNTGWTDEHVALALDAMLASATVLEPLGVMPPVSVVLAGSEDTVSAFVDGGCTIRVGSSVQPNPAESGQFQQHIAMRMAACLVNRFAYAKGWSAGTMNYLSDVIYPNASLEVDSSPKFAYEVSNPDYLRGIELSTNAVNRGSTNWALYEFIADKGGGPEAVVDLRAEFPMSLDPYLHDYNLDLTDGVIHDVAGTHSYDDPPTSRLDVFGPMEEKLTPSTFGLKRLHVVVQPGKYACLNTSSTGNVRVSWRTGRPGTTGSWSDPPDVIEGESVFVVTALRAGASVDVEVTDVSDDPECEDEDETGDIIGPILELCEEICDPSTYYWGPLEFG